jgi:hypothetical protein
MLRERLARTLAPPFAISVFFVVKSLCGFAPWRENVSADSTGIGLKTFDRMNRIFRMRP